MRKVNINLLGIYDLILATGAIFTGIQMINSNNGIFIEYPKEWLSKVPFENWFIPGLIAILLFGLGNIIASIFCFRKGNNKSLFLSLIMGGTLFISLVAQVIILRECFLATVELFILSILQLCLGWFSFMHNTQK